MQSRRNSECGDKTSQMIAFMQTCSSSKYKLFQDKNQNGVQKPPKKNKEKPLSIIRHSTEGDLEYERSCKNVKIQKCDLKTGQKKMQIIQIIKTKVQQTVDLCKGQNMLEEVGQAQQKVLQFLNFFHQNKNQNSVASKNNNCRSKKSRFNITQNNQNSRRFLKSMQTQTQNQIFENGTSRSSFIYARNKTFGKNQKYEIKIQDYNSNIQSQKHISRLNIEDQNFQIKSKLKQQLKYLYQKIQKYDNILRNKVCQQQNHSKQLSDSLNEAEELMNFGNQITLKEQQAKVVQKFEQAKIMQKFFQRKKNKNNTVISYGSEPRQTPTRSGHHRAQQSIAERVIEYQTSKFMKAKNNNFDKSAFSSIKQIGNEQSTNSRRYMGEQYPSLTQQINNLIDY